MRGGYDAGRPRLLREVRARSDQPRELKQFVVRPKSVSICAEFGKETVQEVQRHGALSPDLNLATLGTGEVRLHVVVNLL